MINSKILLSAASIAAAGTLVVGATFAFFSDTGASSSNVFATGTLALKLTDVNQTDQDTVAASFGSLTLVPGSCTGPQTLSLKNTGTIAANHAEVRVANTVTDNVPTATPNMAAYLRINSLTYDGSDVTSQIISANATVFKDLADWAAGTGLDNLALTNLATDYPLVLDVCLDASAPNKVQSDSVSSLFTVDLNQDASQ